MITGSANLPSCGGVEQFVIMHDPNAIDYIQARMDNIMDRFTVYSGVDGKEYKVKGNVAKDAYIAMMKERLQR